MGSSNTKPKNIVLPKIENDLHFGFLFDMYDYGEEESQIKVSKTFKFNNKLRLVLAPKNIVEITRGVLSRLWKIEDTFEQEDYVEFELGNNESKDTDENCMRVLLKEYYAQGWSIQVSSDLQYVDSAPSVVIFEKSDVLNTDVICMSLNPENVIKLLGAPDNTIASVRAAIQDTWTKGIASENRESDHIYGFMLNGAPLVDTSFNSNEEYNEEKSGDDNEDNFKLTQMVCAILSRLYNDNWVYINSIKTGPKQKDLNGLYFRYDAASRQKDNGLMAVTLNGTDTLRLFNGSNEINKTLSEGVAKYWEYGLKDTKEKNNAFVIKFAEVHPWIADLHMVANVKKMLSFILSHLQENNWKLYACCTLTPAYDSKSALFFQYDESMNSKAVTVDCIRFDAAIWKSIGVIGNDKGNIVEAIRSAVKLGWSDGIEDEKVENNVHDVRLNGFPFDRRISKDASIHTLVMVMILLTNMKNQGYSFLASIDDSERYCYFGPRSGRKGKEQIDIDSWYFFKN